MRDVILMSAIADMVSFGVEYALVVWFFRPIEEQAEQWRKWLGYVCLAGLCYLYLTPQAGNAFPLHSLGNFIFQVGRMLYHTATIFGFLALGKEQGRGCAAYQAGVFTLLYLVVQNLRISTALLLGMTGQVNALRWATWLAILMEVLLALVFRWQITLPSRQKVSGIRWMLLLISALLELYFKWSLSAMQDMPRSFQGTDAVFFAISASLAVLLTISLFERNQQAQEKQQKAELEQVSLNYEMQNAKRALQTNNDIRRLYHDMKNHLLAIQGMAEDGGKVEEYLKELLPRFEGYESQVSTGNPTIDALLSEKVQRATLDGIQFNIYMDLSSLGHMKSVDLITIFGNAVDNAIEATQALPEGVERIVYLKSSRMANLTVLRFSNQFSGGRLEGGGTLLTTKSDKEMHGIGLSSIQKAAKRYGGSVTTRIDNEGGWFSLMVMLPD